MKIEGKKVLAIGAHSDDIEYYAGGTLLKMARDNKIFYVIATDGGLNGDAQIRKTEQRRASLFMGTKKTIFLNYPDLGLEDRKKKLHRDLLKIILNFRPDLVFSFDPENQFRPHSDIHPDHRAISLIVADLIFLHVSLAAYIKRVGLDKPPLLLKPELWFFDPHQANHYENISLFWKKKIQLLRLFKSQNLDLKKIKFTEAFKKIEINGKI